MIAKAKAIAENYYLPLSSKQEKFTFLSTARKKNIFKHTHVEKFSGGMILQFQINRIHVHHSW